MQHAKSSLMDWDQGAMPEAPGAPENLQQTGLTQGFLTGMLLRTLYTRGGGAGIVSGKSVFIYGPPGNGKTAVTQAIGNFMNQSGGDIFIPFAFLAEGNVITVFDKAVHQLAEGDGHEPLEDNEATIRR